MLIPFGIALVASLLLTPLVIRGAHRAGILDVPEDDRRAHTEPVPRLGGAIILCATFVAWLGQSAIEGAWWGFSDPDHARMTLGVTIGTGLIFIAGLIDDLHGLSPRLKLLFQVAAALAVVAYGFTRHTIALVPGGATWNAGEWIGVTVMIFWIVGITNAFNLIDGLDGLASTFALIAIGVVIVGAGWIGNGVSLTAPLMIAGGIVGFLRYNWNPARIFLGDSGSMPLGFLLAVLTVAAATDGAGVTYPILPLFALAFPITDTLVAMARRWVRGVSFSVADGRHIHHQLRAVGLTVPQTVKILALIFTLVAALGLTIVFAPPKFTLVAIFGGFSALLVVLIYGLRWLEYDEFIELWSWLASDARYARDVVRNKIHVAETAIRLREARSIEEVRDLLTLLAEQVGLLDIELIEPGQKETLTPPSQQIARLNALPMRLDYLFAWTGSAGATRRAILRLWHPRSEEGRALIMERVALRIGPIIESWMESHAPPESLTAAMADVKKGQ